MPTAVAYAPVRGCLLLTGPQWMTRTSPASFPQPGIVKVTFQNPAGPPQSFEFAPAAKQDDSNTRFVTHKLLESGIGYIRVSKFPGILGIDVARATDAAIRALGKPAVLIIDMRGNLGSVGAGNLRVMSYLTTDRVPVGYSLTRRRAEQGYRREDLAQFTSIPRWKLLAPFTLWKFKDVDKSIALVTEGLKRQPFHGRIIMLVNEHTISGGEIVAGFASEHKLATLIGTPTAGKLLGFATVPLAHECFFTLPTVNYLTWSGKSFEGSGVIPGYTRTVSAGGRGEGCRRSARGGRSACTEVVNWVVHEIISTDPDRRRSWRRVGFIRAEAFRRAGTRGRFAVRGTVQMDRCATALPAGSTTLTSVHAHRRSGAHRLLESHNGAAQSG